MRPIRSSSAARATRGADRAATLAASAPRKSRRLNVNERCMLLLLALFARILLIGKFVELDVVELPADLLHPADVHRLHDVARLGVDRDRAARAGQLEP